jgi:hypothetical protein
VEPFAATHAKSSSEFSVNERIPYWLGPALLYSESFRSGKTHHKLNTSSQKVAETHRTSIE